MRLFPSTKIPEGWYHIGWPEDFPTGVTKPLKYFDTDLVAFRTESGTLVVLDAYCPHMGAHLGYGGVIEGETIRCPFHGWSYGSDGKNKNIPYGTIEKMDRVSVACWPVRVVDNMVQVWYSPIKRSPQWEPPQWVANPQDYWQPTEMPGGTKHWKNITTAAQIVVENAADAAHFRYVHTAKKIPPVHSYSTNGPFFTAELDYVFGEGHEVSWGTPTGPVDGKIVTHCAGLGYIYSSLQGFDTVVHILSVTPVTATTAEIRDTLFVSRLRGDGALMPDSVRERWYRQQHNQVDADINVWGTLSYVDRPPFAAPEARPMQGFRQWAKQFYPEAQQVVSIQPPAKVNATSA